MPRGQGDDPDLTCGGDDHSLFKAKAYIRPTYVVRLFSSFVFTEVLGNLTTQKQCEGPMINSDMSVQSC